MDLTNKQVLVVGLAMSGIGAADLCVRHGALVTVSDNKSEEELAGNLSHLEAKDAVRKLLGRAPTEEEACGFDLIVLSPAVPADLPWLRAARDKGIPVISEIELASWFCKGRMVGITGTNGKTTTTTLMGEILSAWRTGSTAAGNIGKAFTGIAETVPETAWVALELSSFQLETVASLKPSVAAILNFTPDHLNRHHTYENYVAAKLRIAEFQGPEDTLVMNYDDELVREKAEEIKNRPGGPKVLYFAHEERTPGGVWCEDGILMADINGQKTEIVCLDDLRIFGRHNEENAMAAALCALAAGVPVDLIQREMLAFKGVAHRIEYVGTLHGVSYYNDSKGTNPDAAIKGLLAMKSEKTVLIGGGYDKGTPFDDWCRLFPGRVRKLVLIGATAGQIRDCALAYGFPEEDILFCDTFKQAVDACCEAAREGDSVLLSPACASWGMFDNYEQRGDQFRDMIRERIRQDR